MLPLLAGCDGPTVVLGDSSPRPYHFATPVLVTELASPARTDNPTLTADLREIFFTTDRDSGNGDVWVATRASPSAPFGAAEPVGAVNTDAFETSAAISGTGSPSGSAPIARAAPAASTSGWRSAPPAARPGRPRSTSSPSTHPRTTFPVRPDSTGW